MNQGARGTPLVGLLTLLCACLQATTLLGYHYPWDQGHDSVTPTDQRPPEEDDPDCNDEGSPFKAATGAFFYAYQDFSVNALGPRMVFTRTYNSQDLRNGPLGLGWTHTFDIRLIDVMDGVTVSAICRKGTGERFRYLRNPDGSYSPPSDFYSELTQELDGTFTLKEADGTTKLFDVDGLLTAIKDRDGNLLTFTYDATGFLSTVTNATGGQISLTKGANGKIASVTDPMGRIFHYGYDLDGRLKDVTNPLSETTTFNYHSDGKLAKILDHLGRTVQDLGYDSEGRLADYIENGIAWAVEYSPGESKTTKSNPLGSWDLFYNENGNVVKRVNPHGGARTFAYDSHYRLAARVDETGGTTTLTHDARGNLTTETNALGHTTTWVYDQVTGNLLSVTNPENHTTTYIYDTGRLKRVEDGEGLLYELEYYPNGQIHKNIDPNGNETVFAYYPDGLLKSVTTPEGGQTTYEYDGVGNQKAVVDPDGRRTEYDYDGLNRRVAERGPDGNETTFSYDAAHPMAGAGLRTSVIDATGRVIQWEYDQYGRLSKTVFPDLSEIQVSYDPLGEFKTRVDQEGFVTTLGYDELRRLETVQEPGGGTSTLGYDSAGRIRQFIDGGGALTTFDYYATGLMKERVSPDSGISTTTYTDHGLVATTTDARGIQVIYGYDGRQRLESESFPNPQENIDYRWDEAASENGAGRLTSVDDPSGSTRYHYDKDGRLSRVEATIEGVIHTTEYVYSLAGLVERITYPSGIEVTYNPNSRGLTENVVLNNGGTQTTLASSIQYDFAGRLKSFNYGSGLGETRTYDSVGRIESIAVGTVDHVLYGRDDLRGYVTAAIDQLNPSRSRTYGYDADGRLSSAAGPWGTRSLTYDDAGNRKTRTDSSGTAVYHYDHGDNRLDSITGAESTSYTYDNVGNMLSSGARSYAYSQFGRLEAVFEGGAEQASYTYNADNQRVTKQTTTATVVYHYDQKGRLIEESDAVGNVLTSYVYLSGWRPLAKISAGQVEYYHVDQVDTPKALTSDAQMEVWRGDLYPFGELFQENGTTISSLRFPGQVWDEETGLSYNWHRWYQPETGRYGRVDPFFGFGLSEHRYTYSFSNPLTFLDPLGLFSIDPSCDDLGCRPTPGYPSLYEQLRTEAEASCTTLDAEIWDPKLRECVKDRCDSGKITCEDPSGRCRRPPYPGGYALLSRRFGRRSGTAHLCPQNYSPGGVPVGYLGNAVIHEWAHTCGWRHGDGGGVPLDPGPPSNIGWVLK